MAKLDDSFNILRKDMLDEANAVPDPAVSRERFQEAFTAKSERFAAQKGALYTSVDGLAAPAKEKLVPGQGFMRV